MKPLYFVCTFVCLCVSTSLMAQTGSLRGVVTDGSGAAVAAAKITLTRQNGSSRLETSNNRGTYNFGGLTPGDYILQATAPQLFSPESAITINPGVNTADLQLSIAPVVESVTVDQDAAPIGTDAATNASATVVRGADLQALSDKPEDLMTDLQALAGPSAGPSGNSVYVDGFSDGELPPKESIREVRVNLNPFSPEFDKLGLGRIEIITKPGTAKWHGNVGYNHGTDAWNSRNPYSAVKAPLLLNEFESTIGGPLNKRTSFTLDVTQHDVDNGSIVNAVTLNPQTLVRSPFFENFKTQQRRTRVYPRLDHQWNDNNAFSARYSYTKGDIEGYGIGGFDLTSRGSHAAFTVQTAQLTETTVLGSGAVNETALQYYRNVLLMTPNDSGPTVQVLDSFTGGGASSGKSLDTQNDLDFRNITTVVRKSHSFRFGVRTRYYADDNSTPQNFNGTFTFSGGLAPQLDVNNQPLPTVVQIDSLERYRRTLLFQSLGDSPAQVRALGGGASQFLMSAGNPGVFVDRTDVGAFFADDWRARPNLTLNLGLRYEGQTNINDHADWGPRIGLAWAPGKGKSPKTVIRAGFGVFYDRFLLANTLLAKRYNGILQQQYVVKNPDFFPLIPPVSALGASTQITQKVDPNLRTPYIFQSMLAVERQIHSTTLALTYTNSHGVHNFRSLYTKPAGLDPVFLMTSSGVYNQNQLSVNANTKLGKGISLNGSYTLNRALSNTDGLSTFPANPNDYRGEYGPTERDIRHRVLLGGTIATKWKIRLSPLMNIQSGAPFDITTGADNYGTTLFNARPGLVTDPTVGQGHQLIATPYGLLDPTPSPGETLLSRNYGRGPGQIAVNLRISKTITFGPERAKGEHRYSATASLAARNITNHTNPGPIIGNITSPLFGQANRMAGTLNAEGFSENANNRRLEMQLRFDF